MITLLKVIIIGIVEGITEWLPISSTGHMILVEALFGTNANDPFYKMFNVVIQFGAILAVIVVYWKKLWPFKMMTSVERSTRAIEQGVMDEDIKDWKEKDVLKVGGVAVNRRIMIMWFKVVVATIPAAVIGLLLDDWMDENMHIPVVIAIALIIYGIAFIVIENRNKTRQPRVKTLGKFTFLDALKMGLFQCLAIIPGTSRSGATIIGGLTTGISRKLAAEFSFFMSIPVMFGWSLIKLIKFGFNYTAFQFLQLIVGMAVAFFVSIVVIKLLMGYIKKHDFKAFGYYRIALGILVLVVFGLKAIL